jgi:translation initiation factor IF-3
VVVSAQTQSRPQFQEYSIARPYNDAPPRDRERNDGPRINYDINVPSVRLVDVDGEMIGVMPTRQAIQRAEEVGLDLVEISPNAAPPVCKLLDYGKFKYEQQKKRNEARKKQKVIEVKEVKLRPNIDIHDFDVKMRQAKGFFDEGDKVKFTLRFRGREMVHQELGAAVLARVREQMEPHAKVEQMPLLEGKFMVMVMASKV